MLFAISLSQKTYCTNNNCGENWSGLSIVLSGIFNGGAVICWIANPLILISWLKHKKPKISLIFSSLALIFGISFLFFNEIIINEGGFYGEITEYKTGYYLWNFSFVIMILGNILNLKNKKTVANTVYN